MRVCKLLIAVTGASLLMGVLVANASARSISTSSQTVRVTFRQVVFTGVFGSSPCQLTLEGSMHTRTIAKVLGALTGFITRATLGACSQGTGTILTATLPWHIRYRGFEGTLPNITRVTHDFIGVAFSVRETGGISCLTRSTATEPVIGELELSAGVITTATISGAIRTGAECFGAAGTFTSDRGPVTVLNSTTRITIRLI